MQNSSLLFQSSIKSKVWRRNKNSNRFSMCCLHKYCLWLLVNDLEDAQLPAPVHYARSRQDEEPCLWRISRKTVDMRPANQLSMVDTMANITQNSGPVTERTWTYQASPITKLCSFLYWTELLPQMNHQWKKAFETLDRGIFITYVN